ncbi:MAG: ATP-dependent helicase [Bacteriovoracaceae bacterium]
MISLAGLNDPQRLAASTIEGPVLILAGAGSGKTRTITYRIAHMIDNLKIPGNEILGVSFTNKAAKEMKERVNTLLGRYKMKGLTLSTFHSLGVKILRAEIKHLGYNQSFTIYDTSDQMTIVREALKDFRGDKNYDRKMILSKIGFLKNNGISPEEFPNSKFFDPESAYDFAAEFVYNYYQDKLKFYNAIDFDDILFLTSKLFRENPDLAYKYSEKYKYIMIDEYQDTNTLQFQIVLALTSTHNNLCVVGDDDQSIYAFRGADITNILGFEKFYPGATVIKLEENYRSNAPILNLANTVIKENKERKDKTMWTKKHDGNLPLLWATGDTDHEAAVIADEIVKHQAEGRHLADVAVLYRSNTQIPPLEDQLRLNQIPYTVIGGQKFYEKKEVKDMISYLSIIQNPKDELALRRILNVPARGIGNATLDKFLAISTNDKIPLFQALEKGIPDLKSARDIKFFTEVIVKFQTVFQVRPLPEAIALLIEDIEYLNYVEASYDNAKQVVRRKNDVQNFIESARRFTDYFKEKATLKEFLERLLLQDSQDKQEEGEDSDIRSNEVTLMTLHSSKGLEYDVVFLMGMEEEILPHKKTITEGSDISEERRLCYVGMTRAREQLYMTYAKQRKIYGRDVPRFKSRFVNEHIGKLCIEQDRTTFGHLTVEEAKEYKRNFFADLHDSLDD